MLITSANVQALQVGFHNDFRRGYGDTTPWSIGNVATEIPSNTAIDTYGWMARSLIMREWRGPRLIQNLFTHEMQIRNRDYELTVSVARNDIEDDKVGVYAPKFADMGRATRKWPDQLVRERMQANPNGFDGVAMFAATHPLDPGVNQNNDYALALNAANYRTNRQLMMAYTGEDGEPLGVVPNLLVVPPQLEGAGKDIVQANKNAAGADNMEMGTSSLLMVPELANEATRWYLVDDSTGILPWIFQLRRAPGMVMKDGPTDDNVFWDRDVVWGSDSRGYVEPGPWWLMSRSTPP
jgi:phage major head subunit gpT-like protein